jgi:sugar (pentulose or hexulose) kinase
VRQTTNVPYRAAGLCRDPEEWLRASIEALEGLGLAERPAGIGFTGQMHALVALDDLWQPLRPAMLWLDYEGRDALSTFAARNMDLDFVRQTGNVLLPDFTLAKWLLAIEQDRALPSQVRWLVGAKDFVRSRLCGAKTPATDLNEASGTQLLDPFAFEWESEIVKRARVPAGALPALKEPAEADGELSLPAGPLRGAQCVVGAGDQAAAARAVGGLSPGVVSLGLGTSGVLAGTLTLTKGLPAGWDGRFHLFALDKHGTYQVIGTVPSTGPTLAWAAATLGVSLGHLERLAKTASPGHENAPIFLPYLGGTGAPHADTTVAGQLLGIRESTTRAELAYAVFEGLASELVCILLEMAEVGLEVDKVVCSGGGARSGMLLDTFASLATVPVERVQAHDASAAGAALCSFDAAQDQRPLLMSRSVQPSRVAGMRNAWTAERQRTVASAAAPGLLPGTPRP